MIVCLVIVALLITGCFLMFWMRHYKVCVILLLLILALSAFLGGGYVAAVVHERLAPYFYFGVRRTLSERIKVVGLEGDKYEKSTWTFSNGETLPTDKSLPLEVVMRCAFLIVAGAVLIGGRAIVLLILGKFFPKVYAEVTPYLLAKKKA